MAAGLAFLKTLGSRSSASLPCVTAADHFRGDALARVRRAPLAEGLARLRVVVRFDLLDSAIASASFCDVSVGPPPSTSFARSLVAAIRRTAFARFPRAGQTGVAPARGTAAHSAPRALSMLQAPP